MTIRERVHYTRDPVKGIRKQSIIHLVGRLGSSFNIIYIIRFGLLLQIYTLHCGIHTLMAHPVSRLPP